MVMRVGRGADGRAGIDVRVGLRTDRWASERGATVWSGTGVVGGAFPGFAASGGRLLRAKLLLTERYLVVNDRGNDGFGLRLDDLVDFAPVATSAKAPAVLRVVWRDRGIDRAFVLQPRLAPLRAGQPGRLTALVQSVGWATEPVAEPEPLIVPWAEARDFGAESVLWAGRAAAPIAPWGDAAAADVWLTTRALVWAVADGPGLCVVPLAAVTDAAPIAIDRRAATPGLTVAYGDAAGDRHDLVFRFDRHVERDRDVRERGALLVGLRSRGIPLGMPVSTVQPWLQLAAEAPRATLHVVAVAPEVVEAGAQAAGTSTLDDADPTVLPAQGEGDAAPNAAVDPTPPPSTVAISRGLETLGTPATLPHAAEIIGVSGLAAARAGEAALLAAVAALDAALVRGGPAPAAVVLAAHLQPALADLTTAEASGADRGRRARLLALGEAQVRLQTLADLAAAGDLDAAEIDARRRAILAPLASHIFPDEAR